MRVGIVLMVVAMGCGQDRKAASPELCRKACEHVLELAKADIEKSIAKMGEMGDEIGAKLRTQAEASSAADVATCTAQCQAGKLDPECALAAKSIDGAMSCAGSAYGGGGQAPVEPPSERSEAAWPSATLRAVEDEIGGVTFTIQIPTELQEQDADRSPESRGWDFPNQPFSQPRFRLDVGPAFPTTVDLGIAYFAPRDDDEVLTKELVGDRFTLVYKSKTYVVAKVLVRAGDKSLECYGTHSSSAGIHEPELLGAWLADVCATVRVKSSNATRGIEATARP